MAVNWQRILVGIEFTPEGVPASSRRAVDKALWLAARAEAQVHFVHVLGVSESIRARMLSPTESPVRRHYLEVEQGLQALVREAGEQGLRASSQVLFGTDWLELLDAALTWQADLVLLGTRERGVLARSLFGSTGMKLLRKCPCPVWVARPSATLAPGSILVAHDLTAVGEAALEWGARLAAAGPGELHLLHVLEHQEQEEFLGCIDSRERKRRLEAAQESLREQVGQYGLPRPPRLTVEEGRPYVEILNYLNSHPVDLLVMGTVARTGVAGLITGNTAESLLPWLECSLLALKPAGFGFPGGQVNRT